MLTSPLINLPLNLLCGCEIDKYESRACTGPCHVDPRRRSITRCESGRGITPCTRWMPLPGTNAGRCKPVTWLRVPLRSWTGYCTSDRTITLCTRWRSRAMGRVPIRACDRACLATTTGTDGVFVDIVVRAPHSSLCTILVSNLRKKYISSWLL